MKWKLIVGGLFIFSIHSLAIAGTGLLFHVMPAGSGLSISTVVNNHIYPNAGIQITSPGYTLGAECNPISNGYCLFSVSDTTPAQITIYKTILDDTPLSIILCLNGKGPISCQNYTDLQLQPI